MSNDTTFSASGAYDLAQAEPFKAGVIQWVRKPGEGGRDDLGCGFWTVGPADAPGPVEVVIHADETVHILEGRVRIEVADGPTHELTAGDVASFNAGTRTVWNIIEPTVEFFVYS
ncbi:hypothetical protein GCM10022381_34080 [Leifsonia kafniensis]|uniref:(S)-ureidoglycine aminohydrolase cupin domain-containing protein n=1 Tax=Leifsonia kafniensis TaxID=475957 RepID=A0ABP7KZ48_9MICO